MVKPEWGKKRVCQSCATRYYDLRSDPPTCPKCGTVFQVEPPARSRRSRPVEVAKPVPVPVMVVADDVEVEVDDLADDEIDEEDDETLPEDTSELGDDDDVAAVIDTVDPERDEG